MGMELPVYEAFVSKEKGLEVTAVAGVDRPAIQENWMAFKDVNPFVFAMPEERIVVGPAMIPDLKMYRKVDDKEFYVVFSKETIKQVAEMFFESGYQANFNVMHKTPMEGVTFFQSFIKDSSKGLIGMEGDYPDGTWFLGAKFNNDEAWEKVKSGDLKGWSVEGNFGMKNQKRTPEEAMALIEEILSGTELE